MGKYPEVLGFLLILGFFVMNDTTADHEMRRTERVTQDHGWSVRVL